MARIQNHGYAQGGRRDDGEQRVAAQGYCYGQRPHRPVNRTASEESEEKEKALEYETQEEE